MDEISTSYEPVSGDQTPDEQASWFSGFIDIFSAPWEIGRRAIRSPMKVILFAILLETLSLPIGGYLLSKSPGIYKEQRDSYIVMIDKMARNPQIPREQIQEQYDSIDKNLTFDTTNLTKLLAVGILKGAAIIFGLGLLLWVSHRMFTAEPIGFIHLVSLLSFGSAISSVGIIFGSLMQFFGDSLMYAPGLYFLSPTVDIGQPSLLTRVDAFTLWFYAAVGIAIASAAGLSKKTGLIISGIVYGFLMLMFWGYLSLMKMFMG